MELPPVIQILLTEELDCSSRARFLSGFRPSMIGELERQARWTQESFSYSPTVFPGFSTTPAGFLNPISSFGKHPKNELAIISATDTFLRSVALYSDVIALPDYLTRLFAEEAHHLLNDCCGYVDEFYNAITAVRRMAPFLRAGVILFAEPVTGSTSPNLFASAGETAQAFASSTDATYELRRHEHEGVPYVAYKSSLLAADGSVPAYDIRADTLGADVLNALPFDQWVDASDDGLVRRAVQGRLSAAIQTVLAEALVSDRAHSLLLTASQLETHVLGQLHGFPAGTIGSADWQEMRTVRLPWIDTLSPDQLLALRSEAQYALPRLRELLSAARHSDATDLTISGKVSEIRAQAAEVEAEMRSLERLRSHRYRIAVQASAVTFVLFGLASGIPAVAASSLGAFLLAQSHLRSVAKEVVEKETQLVTTPGFALVAARKLQKTA